jgi:hypothetical protein
MVVKSAMMLVRMIDYSIPKPKEKDYEIWNEYFQALCNYIHLKFRDTYGSKEN